jgi:hypothetical protein
MKRLFTTFLLLALGFVGISAQAVISFEKTSHNFGTFPEEQPQTAVFYFTNTGDKPLIIQQAMSTCGCTVASYTKEPVQPGKKGQVTVTYNGKNKLAGHFKKVVTVRTNASNALVRVYIEGDMTIKE